MKKIAIGGLVLVAASLLLASASDADSRHGFHHHRAGARFVVGIGPWWGWGPYPYWYYPPAPYAVYAPPPVVVQETPPVYIQQQTPPPPPVAEQYWYYCSSSRGYYPSVPSCPEAWIKVAPRP